MGHYVFLVNFKFTAVFGVDFLSGFQLVWPLLIILNFLFFSSKSWLVVQFDLGSGLLVLGPLELLILTALVVGLVLLEGLGMWDDRWWSESVTILAQKLSIDELQESWRSWHSRTTRSVHHHAGDLRLVLIVGLGVRVLGNLCHVLEIQKAAEGIGLGLVVHHLHCVSVLVALAMHGAGLDQHELLLVVMIGISVVLRILFRAAEVRLLLVIQMIALLHHHLFVFKIFLWPF